LLGKWLRSFVIFILFFLKQKLLYFYAEVTSIKDLIAKSLRPQPAAESLSAQDSCANPAIKETYKLKRVVDQYNKAIQGNKS